MENSLLIGLSRQVGAGAWKWAVVAKQHGQRFDETVFKSRSPVFEEYLMPTAARGRVSTRRSHVSPT